MKLTVTIVIIALLGAGFLSAEGTGASPRHAERDSIRLRLLLPKMLRSTDTKLVHEALLIIRADAWHGPRPKSEMLSEVTTALRRLLGDRKRREASTRRLAGEVFLHAPWEEAVPVLLEALSDPFEETDIDDLGGTKWTVLLFDDEPLKVVLDELLAEAGVTVLYHAALFDADVADGRVAAVRVAHNGGPIRVPGSVFIDGTGDSLLAYAAGCLWEQGDPRGQVMPMTLNFIVGGVDAAKLPKIAALRERAMRGDRDRPRLINTNVSCFHALPNGRVHFNAVRIPGSGVAPDALSHAEMEGRRRVRNFVDWLRAHVVGFEQCWLVKTGNHIGVRETRRVIGDCVLSFEDLQAARKFDDGVARCAYEVDIHGQEPNEGTEIEVPQGDWYEIPYRCLTPQGLTNLLVAARGVSADAMVHASLRITPVVMNIGEAAGIAAAMSLPDGNVRGVDVEDLRRRLRECGGMV